MAIYRATRKDIYIVSIEADSIEEAKAKANEEDQYLNDGTYIQSDFEDFNKEE